MRSCGVHIIQNDKYVKTIQSVYKLSPGWKTGVCLLDSWTSLWHWDA